MVTVRTVKQFRNYCGGDHLKRSKFVSSLTSRAVACSTLSPTSTNPAGEKLFIKLFFR
jgi:hypothetical protein